MITLAEAKLHLKVDNDDTDSEIQAMIDAAEGHVTAYLAAEVAASPPAPIRAAVLLLVGDLYLNRERQGPEQLFKNHTFDLLLQPYRNVEAL